MASCRNRVLPEALVEVNDSLSRSRPLAEGRTGNTDLQAIVLVLAVCVDERDTEVGRITEVLVRIAGQLLLPRRCSCSSAVYT